MQTPSPSNPFTLDPFPQVVLIADDSDTDRETCRRWLLQHPRNQYEIVSVESGEAAINALEQRRYDLFILDYWLPDFNGEEILQELSEQDLACPPTLVLTGAEDPEIVVQMMQLGVRDYLVKDHLSADKLHERIARVRERSQLEAQLQKQHRRQA